MELSRMRCGKYKGIILLVRDENEYWNLSLKAIGLCLKKKRKFPSTSVLKRLLEKKNLLNEIAFTWSLQAQL